MVLHLKKHNQQRHFQATLNASAPEKITYTPTPHKQPSRMALNVAIESAPLDIKPLLDNRQNVSSEFCSGSVKTDSLCLCYKVDTDRYCAAFCSTSYSGFIGTQSDGYDGTVEVTGWSCFYTRKLFSAQPKLEYQCLDQDSAVKAIKYDAQFFSS